MRLYRGAQAEGNLPLVLYFHGGGFNAGCLDDADFPASFIAHRCPAVVLSVGYALAPQHPFPAAPEDAYAAAQWAARNARRLNAAARSEELGVTRRRAIAEHALAILLGKSPAEFSLAALPLQRISINVPAGLPSSLLERRPDIAAAERAMAAANARIGVAKAAYFPRLNITGALGYESSELGSLFEWSNRTFLLGPLIGTMLSMPIFDGGRREAGLERARAVYEEDVAKYRQTVLNAFGEVEDNLASLRILDNQSEVQDTAVASSQRASHLAQSRYREGLVSYLEVIDADRTLLQQKRVTLQLDGERARATVNLIRALGGSWEAAPVVASK